MKLLFISIVWYLLVIDIEGQGRLYTTSSGGVGAVYTMTNGPIINEVLIYRLNSTGQLIWSNTISTNGSGVNTTATDPLFSQSSMTTCQNYLFVVNPGSNSLSMFLINTKDATQLTLISVQSTNGWFPISVTANSKYVCVLTGGNETGIRCFSYNSSGLFLISTFDRNLTSYISQSIPPNGPPQTFSEILFSSDGLSLIISVKGFNSSFPGYLLFYLITNGSTILSSSPIMQTPSSGLFPFSMTLVGSNGLLITDPGTTSVLTQTYSSTTGIISNHFSTSINKSLANALCWSTYSPNLGNYYVISASPASIVELNLNLTSNTNPVTIIQYYSIPNNTGALETTIVSLQTMDYLYVIGTIVQGINSYRLNGPGNASFLSFIPISQNTSKIAGIAAFLQTSSAFSFNLLQTSTKVIYSMIIFFFFCIV